MDVMTLIVTDPRDQQRLIAERRASGGDRFDEVWEGSYVMSPIADNLHQNLQSRLVSIFLQVVGLDPKTMVLAGTNISDLENDWEHNYRCPDVAVFLPGTSARDCGTHWLGGPDFAVEILSPGDRTPQKMPFYASVNVCELLVIDRKPWSMELHRLRNGQFESAGRMAPGEAQTIESKVLPLAFRLLEGERPIIEVTHPESGQRWSI
jgi:Uma2 family endonuclease